MHVLNSLDALNFFLKDITHPNFDVHAGKMIENFVVLGVPRIARAHANDIYS